jgi:carboxypeptidase D
VARRFFIAILAVHLLGAREVRAAGRGEPGPILAVRVEIRDRIADLELLHAMDADVDGVFGTWARVYVIPEELEKLAGLGFAWRLLPDEDPALDAPYTPAAPGSIPATYHTYDTLTAELQAIAAAHPGIVRVSSLGASVQGRELWMVLISKDPDVQEDEPEVKYVAAMHGDEVVGKELLIGLVNHLVDGYGVDPRVTALVDGNEIWILPSMNPDGTALSRRYNANGYDLNRDFPDQFDDPEDSTTGRQPETAHVMNWGYAPRPVLSANFHGGALVANYPYDGTDSGQSIYSLSPDDALWVSLARTYADRNAPMRASNSDASFTNGICNGADWYVINGGMQDWNYVWHGALDVTLEVSNVKWPSSSQLPQFWNDNLESMLAFLERASEGVRGLVRDAATGAALAARVHVVDHAHDAYTDPDVGDYHRPLLPGAYALEVSSPGYASAHVGDVFVAAGVAATRVDFDLEPLQVKLQPAGARILDADGALSPGETADLALTLENLGAAASGVVAELVPTGWAGTVVRAEAAYPDLPAGGSAESLAPHHEVAAAAGAARAGFAVRWSTDQASGLSAPFFVPIGAPTCGTIASSDIPKTIADRGTASSVIALATDLEISEVDVWVNVTHTYRGDLHLRLRSPAGIPVALHSRSGGSADNVVGWYDDPLVPVEPLSRLNGSHSAGTWRLEAVDGVPMNTGSIAGWSLRICGRPFEPALPPMRIADVASSAEGIDVTWWPYPSASSYKVYRSNDPRLPFTDVTSEDDDDTDTSFHDASPGDLYWLVSGVGPSGEGPATGP